MSSRPTHRLLLAALTAAAGFEAGVASAQTTDPERAGSDDGAITFESDAPGDSEAADDEIVFDPELGELGVEPPPTSDALPEPSQERFSFRVTLATRWGIDTSWDSPRQDVVEGTQIAALEAEHHRSDDLWFSVGLRARHAYGRRREDLGGGRTRHELDVVPLSAFVEGTLTEGLHLRGGYQMVHMGRFDLWNASNFLPVYDLRSGPVTIPGQAEIAQPALRLDLDRTPGFALQAYYLPFFQPHRVTYFGTDYALFAGLGPEIDRLPPSEQRAIEGAFGRSELTTLSSVGPLALSPPPDFTEPQGAIRSTVRGRLGEWSVTVGTALERLPAAEFSSEFAAALEPDAEVDDLPSILDERPISLNYGRYFVFSTDAATDLGPIQVGAEVAYMPNRTLFYFCNPLADGCEPPADQVPVAEQTNWVHTALRAEFVQGRRWFLLAEAFYGLALNLPHSPGAGWFNLEGRGVARGIGIGGRFAPEELGLKFELNGAFISGPTLVVQPRVEWRVVDALFWEVGAAFVQGPDYPYFGAPEMALGGMYNSTDQVFTGLRWLP